VRPHRKPPSPPCQPRLLVTRASGSADRLASSWPLRKSTRSPALFEVTGASHAASPTSSLRSKASRRGTTRCSQAVVPFHSRRSESAPDATSSRRAVTSIGRRVTGISSTSPDGPSSLSLVTPSASIRQPVGPRRPGRQVVSADGGGEVAGVGGKGSRGGGRGQPGAASRGPATRAGRRRGGPPVGRAPPRRRRAPRAAAPRRPRSPPRPRARRLRRRGRPRWSPRRARPRRGGRAPAPPRA
jgi:hypothetical protein